MIEAQTSCYKHGKENSGSLKAGYLFSSGTIISHENCDGRTDGHDLTLTWFMSFMTAMCIFTAVAEGISG